MSINSKGMFKKQLRQWLTDRKFTAAELSRRTGVPKQTISDWLAGTRPRRIEHVKKVADELGVTITELFFGGDPSGKDGTLTAFQNFQQGADKKYGDFFWELMASAQKPSGPSGAYPFGGNHGCMQMMGEFLFLNSHDLLHILDYTMKIRECSESWLNILGYDVKEVRGNDYSDFVHPDTYKDFITSCENQMLSPSEAIVYRQRLRAKSGAYVEVETRTAIDTVNQLGFHLSRVISA